MSIRTIGYEFAHGKKPRGYGLWAFFFEGETEVDKAFLFSGTYGEAAKAARVEATKRDARKIEVGS